MYHRIRKKYKSADIKIKLKLFKDEATLFMGIAFHGNHFFMRIALNENWNRWHAYEYEYA